MRMEMERDTRTKTAIENPLLNRRSILLGGTTLAAATAIATTSRPISVAQVQQPAGPSGRKPNILVIWGDDIGITDLSVYSLGLMGFCTPNIDRIAREGMIFTDYTASRVAPRAGRRSSPGRACSAPACQRSASRAPR
jgi:Sulfatase